MTLHGRQRLVVEGTGRRRHGQLMVLPDVAHVRASFERDLAVLSAVTAEFVPNLLLKPAIGGVDRPAAVG